jgi:hypothetical protein
MGSQREAMALSLETESVSVTRDLRFFTLLAKRNYYFAAQAAYKKMLFRVENLFAWSLDPSAEPGKKMDFLAVWERSAPGTTATLKTFICDDFTEEDRRAALLM